MNKFFVITLAAMLLSATSLYARPQNVGPPQSDGEFSVTFLDVKYNPNGTSTWTYAACYDTDSGSIQGLSNIVFDFCDSATVVSPAHNSDYYTIAWPTLSDEKTGLKYGVEIGTDPHSGINGIKFNYEGNSDDALGDSGDACHVFQFTLDKWYAQTSVFYGLKFATNKVKNSITGPGCDTIPVIPLPAAAWSGLAGLGLVVLPALKRRVKQLLA